MSLHRRLYKSPDSNIHVQESHTAAELNQEYPEKGRCVTQDTQGPLLVCDCLASILHWRQNEQLLGKSLQISAQQFSLAIAPTATTTISAVMLHTKKLASVWHV